MSLCRWAVLFDPEGKQRGFCIWGLVIPGFPLTRVSWGLTRCARRKKWNGNTMVKMQV